MVPETVNPACPSAPQAAYIHVPFCRHRCGYCNFTLVAQRDDLIDDYLAAVERELSWLQTPRDVRTVFIGGGTPTHLKPPALEQLLDLIDHWFPPSGRQEYTVEANPADLNPARIALLQRHGVNRISLGAQSFQPAKLHRLERDHDAATIRSAAQLVRSISAMLAVDMIFAAPDESLKDWTRDLDACLDLAPDHVSCYGLTIERGSAFWGRRERGQLASLSEDLEAQMYLAAIDQLSAAGLEHYEVSNFALAGKRCLHNENYWTSGSYYAAGPGAARFVDGRREINHRSTSTYLKRVLQGESPVAEHEQLDAPAAARERLVFALRRLQGVDVVEFQQQTGFSIPSLVGEPLGRFLDWGLLEQHRGNLRLTRKGLLISDSLWSEFLAPE